MKLSRVVAAGLGSVVLVAASATSAFAGEVTGNGKPTQAPSNSNSLCSYSGQNDDLAEEPGRVQSYGQIVKAGGKAFVPSPSVGCNPNRGFEE